MSAATLPLPATIFIPYLHKAKPEPDKKNSNTENNINLKKSSKVT